MPALHPSDEGWLSPVLERLTAGPRPAVAQVELVSAGLALPAVPLAGVVASYTYDLLPDGTWVAGADDAVLRIEVTAVGTWVRALVAGVAAGGRPMAPGEYRALADGDTVQLPSLAFRFETANCSSARLRRCNFGYAGLLLRDAGLGVAVPEGVVVELGREPGGVGLRIPDRGGQGNLRWCLGVRAEKARALGYDLDRALIGRRHVAVRVEGDRALLTHLHAHQRLVTCVRRAGARGLERVEREVELGSGDRIVVGTALVLVRNT